MYLQHFHKAAFDWKVRSRKCSPKWPLVCFQLVKYTLFLALVIGEQVNEEVPFHKLVLVILSSEGRNTLYRGAKLKSTLVDFIVASI